VGLESVTIKLAARNTRWLAKREITSYVPHRGGALSALAHIGPPKSRLSRRSSSSRIVKA